MTRSGRWHNDNEIFSKFNMKSVQYGVVTAIEKLRWVWQEGVGLLSTFVYLGVSVNLKLMWSKISQGLTRNYARAHTCTHTQTGTTEEYVWRAHPTAGGQRPDRTPKCLPQPWPPEAVLPPSTSCGNSNSSREHQQVIFFSPSVFLISFVRSESSFLLSFPLFSPFSPPFYCHLSFSPPILLITILPENLAED